MNQTNDQIEFSVIICCYFEEKSIDEFYHSLSRALNSLGRTYEIVFVNDGSTDKTFEKLQAIYEADANAGALINLYRNSGQLAAMTAGIANARGENFIFMDSDLQLVPEELPLLVEQFDKGYDIVSGCRVDRKDSLVRKISSWFANRIMRKVAGHNVMDFGCTFKIYNGTLVRAFEFGPHKIFQTAYVYSKAQKTIEVPITHKARKHGKSGWTFKKLFSFLMDNFVGISQRPFQYLSMLCLMGAAIFALRIMVAWVVPFSVLREVTPGLILNMILVQLLLTMGVLSAIGEYVFRNFSSLQKYPIYIVRTLLRKSSSSPKE
ncbi:MAG: glycosyltransferase family 2 protein [Planctomycetes bacterium]|nr:glycosyltransferase family 2 protein [Planctomycetota bacterium]